MRGAHLVHSNSPCSLQLTTSQPPKSWGFMSHHIRGTRSDLIAFLVLSIWPSHIGLPLLLAIVLLSKKIQRHPTFINMCVTWIITGFSCSILYVFFFLSFHTTHYLSSPTCDLSTDSMPEKNQVQNLQRSSASYRLLSCSVYFQWSQ